MMHPGFLSAASDRYYENLVNRIYKSLYELQILVELPDKALICDFVSKTAAGYLEDKASDFGVWNAFVTLHERRYGKPLPFYDIPEGQYEMDTIHVEDVRFMVWMAFNMIANRNNVFLSPRTPANKIMADTVYRILYEEWEKAPEAIRITNYLQKSLAASDWLTQREVASWLSLNCYLTCVPELFDHINRSEGRDGVSKEKYQYAQIAMAATSTLLRPLGLAPSEYMAVMAERAGYEKNAALWKSMEYYGLSFYHVVSVGKESACLETVTRLSKFSPCIGEKVELALESLQPGYKGVNEGKYIMCTLVKWNGRCELNGMMMSTEDKATFENEAQFPQMTREQLEAMKERTLKFIDKNGGDRFVYFDNWSQLFDFFEIPEGIRPKKREKPMEKCGLTCYIADEGNQAISLVAGPFLKDSRNPFYDEAKASGPGAIMSLFISDKGLSHEGALYAAKHGLLADGNIGAPGGDTVQGKALFEANKFFIIDFYNSMFEAL